MSHLGSSGGMRCTAERGSMMLFVAAIILPLVFFFFTLTLDLERYFHLSAEAQELADEAALYGYRFLPDVGRAEDAVRAFVAKHESLSPHTTVKVLKDLIRVEIVTVAPVAFADLVSKLGGGGGVGGVPITVFSEVRGTPLDVVVALDVSGSLAPPLDGVSWEDETSWPTPTLFRDYFQHVTQSGKAVSPKVAGEQCFNAIFLPLKTLATKLYTRLASYHLNSVGMGFFPGLDGAVDMVKEVELPQRSHQSEARWLLSGAGGSPVLNDHCLAAAYHERDTDRYKAAFLSATDGEPWKRENDQQVIPVQSGSWSFNPEYAPYLSVREVVWAQAARAGREGGLGPLLRSLGIKLIAAPTRQDRGGLKGRAASVGVVVSARLPEVTPELVTTIDYLTTLLNEAGARPDMRIVFEYVLVRSKHERSPLREIDAAAKVVEIEGKFAQVSNERVKLQLISSSDEETLSDQVVDAVMLEAKRGMVAR